jgi:hypothetical protein
MDVTAGIGFKVVDADNVLAIDPLVAGLATKSPGGTVRPTAERDFARTFAAINVEPHVPLEVRRGFLFARNAMCYGYWCYGMLTLGAQQRLRVADDALAYAERGIAKRLTFADRIRKLVELGDIPAEDEIRWDGVRNLRNSATHQKFQQIWSPGMAGQMVSTVATLLARVTWRLSAPIEIGQDTAEPKDSVLRRASGPSSRLQGRAEPVE